MSSTDHDRPISSTIPVPQWMKTKLGDRYDINEPFSPPQQDDDFFYIRYPRSQQASVPPPPPTPRITTAATALKHLEQEKRVRSMATMGLLANHTEPCRPFIGQLPPTHEIEGWSHTRHPPGTDDGFKGTSAQCGQSVVDVAQQIVSKRIGSEEKDDDNFESSWQPPASSLRHRRNSKSLPGSPKAQRKLQHPFFTGMFGGSTLEGSSGSLTSLLSGFLSNPRNEVESANSSSTTKMRRNQSLSVISDNLEPKYEPPNNPVPSLQAKPSEFREMNFISPTSF